MSRTKTMNKYLQKYIQGFINSRTLPWPLRLVKLLLIYLIKVTDMYLLDAQLLSNTIIPLGDTAMTLTAVMWAQLAKQIQSDNEKAMRLDDWKLYGSVGWCSIRISGRHWAVRKGPEKLSGVDVSHAIQPFIYICILLSQRLDSIRGFF